MLKLDTLKKLDFNRSVVFIVILLPIVYACILFDVHILRQVLTPLYFTLALGYLTIMNLNLNNKLKPIEVLIFSIGIGISLIMIIGTFLNLISLSYNISSPLSLNIIVSVFIIIILLCVIIKIFLYIKKYNYYNIDYPNYKLKLDLKNYLIIIIPLFLPLFVLIGIHLLDSTGNNHIIIIALIFIIIYSVLIYIWSYKKKYNNDFILSLNIYMISLSLLFLHSMPSNYLAGYNDIEREFYLFIKTLLNKRWDPCCMYSSYNACMSITVLPTIYDILMGLKNHYICFKIVLQFIIALFPVGIYLILRQQKIESPDAFVLTLMCIFQYQFILLAVITRTGIGLFIFTLVVLTLLHNSIPEINKKIIIQILLLSIVLSHYTTTYITLLFFIIVSIYYLILDKKIKYLNIAIYVFVTMILWYTLIVEPAYSSIVEAIKKVIIHIPHFLEEEAYGETTLKAVGAEITNIPQIIKVFVYDTFYGIILIGIIIKMLESIKNKKFSEIDIFNISMFTLFLCFIIFPYATKIYSIERASLQILIILIFGLYYFITKLPIIRNYKCLFCMVLVMSLAFVSTGLNYELFGVSQLSPLYLSKNSSYRHFIYIYDGEVFGGLWLNKTGDHENVVYGDFVIDSRFVLSTLSLDSFEIGIIGNSKKKFWIVRHYCYFKDRGANVGDYLYLRFFNIKYNKFYDGCAVHYINGTVIEEKRIPFNLSNSNFLIKIYDNGYSQIYIFTKRLKPTKLL